MKVQQNPQLFKWLKLILPGAVLVVFQTCSSGSIQLTEKGPSKEPCLLAQEYQCLDQNCNSKIDLKKATEEELRDSLKSRFRKLGYRALTEDLRDGFRIYTGFQDISDKASFPQFHLRMAFVCQVKTGPAPALFLKYGFAYARAQESNWNFDVPPELQSFVNQKVDNVYAAIADDWKRN